MFAEILSAIRKKIDSFRCVMKCGRPINPKELDILDEEVSL